MRKLARWFHQSAVTTPCTIQTALLPVRNFLESAIPPCHNSVRPPDPRLLALLRIALVALHAMRDDYSELRGTRNRGHKKIRLAAARRLRKLG